MTSVLNIERMLKTQGASSQDTGKMKEETIHQEGGGV